METYERAHSHFYEFWSLPAFHSVSAAIIINVVIKSLHCIGRIVASRPLVSGEGARETLAKVFFVSMTESL